MYAAVNGWVVLKRDSKIGQILSSGAELKLIEGRAQPQDQVVLATNQAKDISGEIEQKLSQGFEIDSIITGLVPRVHDQPDSSLTALAFVSAAAEEPPETVPLLEVELNVPDQPSTVVDEPQPTLQAGPLSAIDASQDQSSPRAEASVAAEVADPATIPLPEETLVSINDLSNLDEEAERPSRFGSVDREDDVTLPGEADEPFPAVSVAPTGLQPDTLTSAQSSADLTKRDFATQHLEARPSLVNTFSVKAQGSLRAAGAKLWKLIQQLVRYVRTQSLRLKDRVVARDMYLTKPSPRRLVRIIVPVVLVVVIGGGWWLFSQARAQQEISAMDEQLQPLRLQIASAQSRVQREPVAARAELESLLQDLERLKTEYAQQPNALKVIEAEIAATRSIYDEVSGREEFQALPQFFDLRSLAPSFIANLSDASGDQAVFLDTEQKQLIVLNTQTKEGEVKSVAELNTPVSLSLMSEEAAIVTLGNGIQKTTFQDTPQLSELKAEGDSNREARLVDTYGQFVYVFNAAKNNIYRYAPAETGYSDPIGWLRSAPNLVFNEVSSMQIDGDLWLGTRTGEILRFTQGRPAEFAITGMSQPFNSTLILATDSDTQNLYVLEAGQQRVVVLSKNGEFLREVKSASLASATQIIALEQQNKVLVLSGSLLFEIGL
jgi:hypothetical protein